MYCISIFVGKKWDCQNSPKAGNGTVSVLLGALIQRLMEADSPGDSELWIISVIPSNTLYLHHVPVVNMFLKDDIR